MIIYDSFLFLTENMFLFIKYTNIVYKNFLKGIYFDSKSITCLIIFKIIELYIYI